MGDTNPNLHVTFTPLTHLHSLLDRLEGKAFTPGVVAITFVEPASYEHEELVGSCPDLKQVMITCHHGANGFHAAALNI